MSTLELVIYFARYNRGTEVANEHFIKYARYTPTHKWGLFMFIHQLVKLYEHT